MRSLSRPPALAMVVESSIREAIEAGELSLGEAVSEERLATMLGVSRTPVREALNALQIKGLISIQPQRGSFVFQPDEQEIAELCEYRLLIETRAMHLSYARNRSETATRLETTLATMVRCDAAGDATGAARADAEFHGAFLTHCGNRLLEQAYTLAAGRIGAIRFFARGAAASRGYANREHRSILTAFVAGDLSAAETVLKPHILNMHVRFIEASRGPS